MVTALLSPLKQACAVWFVPSNPIIGQAVFRVVIMHGNEACTKADTGAAKLLCPADRGKAPSANYCMSCRNHCARLLS